MLNIVWHMDKNGDAPLVPATPSDRSSLVDVWIGTNPAEQDQSVWIGGQELDDPCNRILTPVSAGIEAGKV